MFRPLKNYPFDEIYPFIQYSFIEFLLYFCFAALNFSDLKTKLNKSNV